MGANRNMTSKNLIREKLINVVGRFEDIKHRQEMFRIMDKVNGYGDIDSVSISSGSLSEGLQMKGSDEDISLVLKYIIAVPCNASFVGKKDETVVLVDFDKEHPGFAKMYPMLGRAVSRYVQNASVLSSLQFREQFLDSGKETHGPCCNDGERDFAICIRCPFLPDFVAKRFENRKSKWLQEDFLREVLADGCLMVPIGPKSSEKSSILWRLSFVLAERKIILKLNYSQILCYALLKMVLKEGLEQNSSVQGILCSYFLKTCLFWMIDETDDDDKVWNVERIFDCYELCLDRLILWVATGNCPNYFTPKYNMFRGRMDEENKHALLSLLKTYKSEGCLALLRFESFRLQQTEMLTDAQREANLDLFCFRVLHIYPFDEIELAYSAARDLEKMYTTETDDFVLGVINKLRSSVHQEIAQMLPLPHNMEGLDEEKHRESFVKHLNHILIGGQSDALSGPLLLACFYYNLAQYTEALKVLEEAEKDLNSNLLDLRKEDYSQEYDLYHDTMCGKGLSLSYKMKHATANTVIMLENSSLIPEEFLPEIQHRPLCIIPSSVLLYSMKYLCNNKLHDAHKKLESLSKLENAVKSKLLILPRYYSTALTFLGACYEIEGDTNEAIKYYKLALEQTPLFKSAQCRIDRLQING